MFPAIFSLRCLNLHIWGADVAQNVVIQHHIPPPVLAEHRHRLPAGNPGQHLPRHRRLPPQVHRPAGLRGDDAGLAGAGIGEGQAEILRHAHGQALADCYENGRGVPKDANQAAYWREKAKSN